uniref:Uncharacterized protein n=1 Tax=Tanacetum cinerariifolium TaxID=118510 RepID=A0A6L2K0Z3_TANCI|nr:hypothetical protein [Tanacetum cinerariifolium]
MKGSRLHLTSQFIEKWVKSTRCVRLQVVKVKTGSSPIEPNKALVKDAEDEDVDIYLYKSMIGSLMYLTASRPDITFAVCACARFQVTPNTSHLHVVKRIFRYLKGQPKLGLWYPRDSPFDFKAYSNSDYDRASLDRKSTTGGCQFLGKRQVLWIQNQMLDYGFNFLNIKIYIDNERYLHRLMIHLSQEVTHVEVMTLNELTILCRTLLNKMESLEIELKMTKQTYGAAFTKLIKKVKKLEKTVKTSKAKRQAKIMISDDDMVLEDSSKQERMVKDIDQDARVILVTPTKLKKLSFKEIKELFEATMRRIQDFVPIKREGNKEVLKFAGVRGSKRDVEEELDHGSSKKQKTDEASRSVQEQLVEEEKELSQEDLQ